MHERFYNGKPAPKEINRRGESGQNEKKALIDSVKSTVEFSLRSLEAKNVEITHEYIKRQEILYGDILSGEPVEFHDLDPVTILPHLSTISSSLKTGEGHEENDLLSQCVELTSIVQVALAQQEIPSKRIGTVAHDSLILNVNAQEVMVDPSIGQLIKDHPQIFVGTRDDLTTIIKKNYAENSLVNIYYYASTDVGVLSPHPTAEEILKKFWGITESEK